MTENNSKSSVAMNYYDSEKKKIGDVLLVLFGNWGICVVFYMIIIFLTTFISSIIRSYSLINFLGFFPILLLVLDILAIVHFRKIGRRYISTGILLSIIIPIVMGLLVFGACLIVIAGLGYGGL